MKRMSTKAFYFLAANLTFWNMSYFNTKCQYIFKSIGDKSSSSSTLLLCKFDPLIFLFSSLHHLLRVYYFNQLFNNATNIMNISLKLLILFNKLIDFFKVHINQITRTAHDILLVFNKSRIQPDLHIIPPILNVYYYMLHVYIRFIGSLV